MFVGSTGTGKSYMAKKMADFLDIKLITFDMTSYRTPESFDRFIDSLSQSLILYPYAIYLFEEVDKADSKILDRLYFMTDEGVLYDKYQRPLFARGAYIIITTNAAEEAILSNPNSPTLTEDVNAELRKLFRPSFLNRMDAISIFKPFTQPEYRQLAEIMVKKKIKSSREIFDWALTVDGPSLDYIAKNGQSARYGARPMERLIDSVIASGVAEWQLAHGPLFAENQVAIRKAQPVNDFTCLSQDKQVNYTVDPDVNSGSKLISGYSPRSDFAEYLMMKTKIEEALKDQSIWSDRD
jgi:ATP-dependent Clp protease ATP-binding subunit ClpA